MIQGMLWIIGIYGISMSLVHIAHLLMKQKDRQDQSTHYILISNHNQLQIEWYIRSLLFFSWMRGKTSHITIMDQGSTDETLDIIHKLSLQCRVEIRVLQGIEDIGAYLKISRLQLFPDNTIVIDLNNEEDLNQIHHYPYS